MSAPMRRGQVTALTGMVVNCYRKPLPSHRRRRRMLLCPPGALLALAAAAWIGLLSMPAAEPIPVMPPASVVEMQPGPRFQAAPEHHRPITQQEARAAHEARLARLRKQDAR